MESRQLYLRLTIFRTALVALLAILVARLWYLQIAQWANYDRAAEKNRTRINWLPAPRGTIYDRNGETLADNRVVYQIRVAPTDLPTEKDELNDVIVRLAAILRVPTVKVEEAIKSARQAGTPEIVLPRLGESIQWREAVRLDDHRHQLPGITVAEACERHYPFGSLASHVLGYARAISPEEYYEVRNFTYEDPPESSDNRLRGLVGRQKVYAQDSIYGKTGIERMCETVILNGRPTPALQGRRGADEFEIDALNRVRLIRHIPPIRGASVYLTLDRRLQQVTEEALAHPFPNDPTRPCPGGAAVLVDVRSGEIVAMASYPAINLNKYITGFAVDEWQRLLRDERHPDLNRAIAGLYPTGSTFKMVTACAILECTAVNLGTTYLCTGREVFGRRHEVRTCWRAEGHGPVDFTTAIAESCDIYFWKCVTDAGLTADDIADYAHRFGFGELTGCGLPTEQEGLVPTPEWKRESDRGRWYQGDTANLVIGQGDLKATPLQVAMATAAVANRGVLPRARIVRKIVWPRESGIGVAQWPKEPPRHIDVKPETLEAVRRGMRATVTFRNGTARGPMGGLPVTVAAKTGSAEVRKDQTPHSWFVWFAPYEQPRYACAVIVEYGGYGSEVAGWVARKILLAAFSHLSPASVASRRSPNAG